LSRRTMSCLRSFGRDTSYKAKESKSQKMYFIKIIRVQFCWGKMGLDRAQDAHHVNVRFFCIKDCITAGEMELQYCPTEQMIGDIFTKAQEGQKNLLPEDCDG
jgi:hypothetical protein